MAVFVVVWGVEAAVVFIDVVETLVAEVGTVTDDFVVDFAEVNSTDEAADVGIPVAPVDVESVSTNQYNTLRSYYALNLHRVPKNQAPKLLAVTLSNLNRF